MKGLTIPPRWAVKILPRWAWITSHTLFIVSLVLATICLYSILPPGLACFATVAIWCFAGGLCLVFSIAFAKLVAKQ